MNKTETQFTNKLSTFFFDNRAKIVGKSFCVCLSGGADSVSLLRGILMISDSFGFNITAAHFNHMIRGEEADRDERFCKDLCDSLGVKLYCGRDDVPAYSGLHKLSLEAAARECRYAFFDRILAKNDVDYCLTAHTMNDDAETLLYNLIRGSGMNGASSIAPMKDGLIRPLLKFEREEVESFLTAIGQDYILDSSNNSDDFTRNFIRHNIIPAMTQINPSVVKSLARFIDTARADRDYFESVVNDYGNADLRALHPSVRDRKIMSLYENKTSKKLSYDMLSKINKALLDDKRTLVSLSDYEALVDNGTVVFLKKLDTVRFDFNEVTLDIGENHLFNGRVSVHLYGNNSCNNKTFNKIYTLSKISPDNIIGDMIARNRRTGDKILINGMHKSLKKLFIEKKIPIEYRNIIPIICDDEGIIYVPFIGVADRVKAQNTDNTIDVITILNSIDKERWTIADEK